MVVKDYTIMSAYNFKYFVKIVFQNDAYEEITDYFWLDELESLIEQLMEISKRMKDA